MCVYMLEAGVANSGNKNLCCSDARHCPSHVRYNGRPGRGTAPSLLDLLGTLPAAPPPKPIPTPDAAPPGHAPASRLQLLAAGWHRTLSPAHAALVSAGAAHATTRRSADLFGSDMHVRSSKLTKQSVSRQQHQPQAPCSLTNEIEVWGTLGVSFDCCDVLSTAHAGCESTLAHSIQLSTRCKCERSSGLGGRVSAG